MIMNIYLDDNIHDALEKISGAKADAYKRIKPALLKVLQSRSPRELKETGKAYVAVRGTNVFNLSPRIRRSLPKQLTALNRPRGAPKQVDRSAQSWARQWRKK